MINAGDYNKKIKIFAFKKEEDGEGFKEKAEEEIILEPYAKIKTTKGFTLIANNTDFEKAENVANIEYKGKTYTIEYLNNVDEANVELEMQCKRVTK